MFQCGKTRESAFAPQSDDNYTRHHKIHCWGSPNLTRADILPTSHDDAKHPCGRLYGIKRISNKFRRPQPLPQVLKFEYKSLQKIFANSIFECILNRLVEILWLYATFPYLFYKGSKLVLAIL